MRIDVIFRYVVVGSRVPWIAFQSLLIRLDRCIHSPLIAQRLTVVIVRIWIFGRTGKRARVGGHGFFKPPGIPQGRGEIKKPLRILMDRKRFAIAGDRLIEVTTALRERSEVAQGFKEFRINLQGLAITCARGFKTTGCGKRKSKIEMQICHPGLELDCALIGLDGFCAAPKPAERGAKQIECKKMFGETFGQAARTFACRFKLSLLKLIQHRLDVLLRGLHTEFCFGHVSTLSRSFVASEPRQKIPESRDKLPRPDLIKVGAWMFGNPALRPQNARVAEIDAQVLIVGQGLAGTLLAYALRARGCGVIVIDDGHRHCASMVAAGLVNPLAGIRFNHAPQTAAWLASAEQTWRRLEHALGIVIWHPLPMLRLFRSAEQIRFWERRRSRGPDPYAGEKLESHALPPTLRAPYGGFLQTHTGFVDLPTLLAHARNDLRAAGAFVQQPISARDIVFDDAGGVEVAGLRGQHLVLCTGAMLKALPGFEGLPLQAEKGEILDIESRVPISREIVNAAHWLIPHSRSHYRFGATHSHTFSDWEPTEAGRATLKEGLSGLINDADSVRVTRHTAGVRPSTRDRAPLLGTHPKQRALHVFNGFGGRGCLKIPWYAERFADYLVTKAGLPPEAEIRRFEEAAG